MIKHLIFTTLILLSTTTYGKADIQESVVKIFTAKQSHSFNEPWKSNGIRRVSATGFIIDNNRIVTNAHAVSNSRYIQVRFGDNPKKRDVVLEYISDDYDLALLKFADETDLPKIKPLKFTTALKLKEKVVVYGYPVGGDKISITEGIISRIQLQTHTFSQKGYSTIQTDAAINPGNSGGPVIFEGKVIGVAFQGIRGANNIGYVIPSHIIQHFLNDVKDKQYDGIPSLGIKWMTLESSIHRNMLGMHDYETGVLIKSVNEFSSAHEKLQHNDVILKIEDTAIGIDGSIKFNANGRIGLSYIMEQKEFGDSLSLDILRGGKRITTTVKLEKPSKQAVIDVYKSHVPPSYFISSGFVFEKLSINYLNQYTKSYMNSRYMPYKLINMQENPPEDVDEIIFIVSVLPDISNEGYQDLKNVAIMEINGEKVKNFADFITKLTKQRYAVLKDLDENEIVIDNQLSLQRNEKIKEIYNISSLVSKDLKQL